MRRADILVAAIGRPRFVTADMVAAGRDGASTSASTAPTDGLRGDVDAGRPARSPARSRPVPGGVGPMTIAMLMRNTLEAARASVGEPTPVA